MALFKGGEDDEPMALHDSTIIWQNRHPSPSTFHQGSSWSLNFEIGQSSPSTFVFRSSPSLNFQNG